MQSCRAWWKAFQGQTLGVTLVEFLLGSAITVVIAMTATSMLLANQSSRRMLQQQTDRYDSIRIAADAMVEDARFASRVSCDFDWLQLYTVVGSANDYIRYQFADANGEPDPENMHRVVVVGGVVQRDDIVAWSLVPFDWWGGESTFLGCNTLPTRRTATIHLVKAGHKPAAPNIILEFTIFLRT